ncbi:membrane hypothetical protein [Azospirillaceae bacterium]
MRQVSLSLNFCGFFLAACLVVCSFPWLAPWVQSIHRDQEDVNMRYVMMAMALAMMLLTSPASAQSQPVGGQMVQISGSAINPQDFPAEQWVSIGVWALVGASAANAAIEGTLFSVAGTVVGALVGDWWYRERRWPFR